MRPILIPILLVPMAALAQDAPTGDLKSIQGAWTAMVGPNKDFPVEFAIDGAKVSIKWKTPEGQEGLMKGEIKLDESKSPKQWDWLNFELLDGTSVKSNLAIYKLDGDKLSICSGGPEKDRPTEFKDDPSGMPNLVEFTRKKPDGKAAN